MEDFSNFLNGNDVLGLEKFEVGLEMVQSILSKFFMKILFGFISKLEFVKFEEEDVVLKVFYSLVVDFIFQFDDFSNGLD